LIWAATKNNPASAGIAAAAAAALSAPALLDSDEAADACVLKEEGADVITTARPNKRSRKQSTAQIEMDVLKESKKLQKEKKSEASSVLLVRVGRNGKGVSGETGKIDVSARKTSIFMHFSL
jgi:hypothetical protein